MLNDKQDILDKNTFLNERKNAKIISKFEKSKRLYLILSVLLCVAVISTIYLLTDKSNIRNIDVNGNVYLKTEDILKDSGISTSTKYLFTNTKNVETKLLANPIIDTCEVKMMDDQTVSIEVKEKKLIGYALEDDQNVLILADDSRVILTKANFYLIEKIPLIEGFSKDDIILIEKNLQDVDYKMINEISEIHYYPFLKFQDHEIIMRDGNYIFTSVYGMNRVNRYYDIVSSYTDGSNKCYYIEDISGNAYTSACPWEPVVEEETKEDDDSLDEDIQEDEDDEEE